MPGMRMKTTLNLDDQVLKQAKAKAAQNGLTLTRFVEDALRARLLPAYSARTKTRVKLPIVTGLRPPNVDISDRDALYHVIDHE